METWKIGNVEITRVVDVVTPLLPSILFPDATPERVAELPGWLRPNFIDGEGNMLLSMHAFAIRSGDARILVDTCVGRDKIRPHPDWTGLQSDFLEDLAAIDFAPDSIDCVLCTHLCALRNH